MFRGCYGGECSGWHLCVIGKVELSFENDGVCFNVAEIGTNIPKGSRPYLPVVVNAPVEVLWIVKVTVDPTQAVGYLGGIGNRIPVGNTGRVRGWGDHIGHCDCPIVCKALTDGASFDRGAESERDYL
jgi:hypothetical protein